jgi:outer membrane protein TolC
VGKAAQQDVLKIQTQLSILDTRIIQLDRERGARDAELLSLLNRKPGETIGAADLPRPPAFGATLEDLLGAARKQSPILRREEKMIQRNQAAVDLARKDFYPDYAVAGGYYNMGGMRDMYMFRVDFKLPTSWFRKQRPAVAESVHMLAGSRKSLEAAAQDVAYRIQDEYLAATTAERLMKLYEESIVPQSNLALESSLSSYESGAVDLLTVLMNFMTVLDYEMNYYSELANYLVALARLEEMTGAAL